MNAELTEAGSTEQHLRAQLELLQNHDSSPASASPNPSARDPRGPPSRPPNGYDVLAPQDVARPLAKLDAEAHIHPDLRASVGHAPAANMMPMVPPAGHSPGPAGPGPSAIPLAPAPPQQMALDDSNPDGRKAKRELSQSKRAAQNRAAQVSLSCLCLGVSSSNSLATKLRPFGCCWAMPRWSAK